MRWRWWCTTSPGPRPPESLDRPTCDHPSAQTYLSPISLNPYPPIPSEWDSENNYNPLNSLIQQIDKLKMKKRCYYQILQVQKKSSTSDIKQSYRKMALKYHPDKNDGEEAKQMFIEIQEAYQVLSDPNERTWYDNNREKILFDKDSMTKEDLEMHTFGFNIWEFFSPGCYKGYEDTDENNFYKVYRGVFERIKESEKQAYQYQDSTEEEMRVFEGFGVADTTLDKVLKFYQDWDNVTTYKSFVWKQEWDTKQAPNRWVRREMEKENKKQRQKERKFYIKTIKDLISYLKKRDPRYQNHLMELSEKEKKRQEEKKVRMEEEKRQKELQKENKKLLEEERLREVEEYYKQQGGQNESEGENEVEREEEEEFYCEICEKGFKSQNQLNNHSNSKMHKQNLKLLMSQVVLDSDKKELEKVITKSFEPIVKQKPQNAKQAKETKETKQQPKQEAAEDQEKQVPGKKKKKNKKRKQYQLSSEEEPQTIPQPVVVKKQEVKKEESDSESGDDGFMSAMLKNKGKGNKTSTQALDESEEQKKQTKGKKKNKPVEKSDEEEKQEAPEKTLGKAKQKRLKKLEKEQEDKTTFKCTVCKQSFVSKTKLFSHISEVGHAAAKK